MHKKYLLLLAFLIFGSVLIYLGFINKKDSVKPLLQTEETTTVKDDHDEVHLHAGFQVYDNNKLVNFSELKYMHINPCGEDDHTDLDQEEEQEEKAHLHDMVGDVVHVHRKGAMWGDLFTNIKYELESDARSFINGLEVENIMETEIGSYDSVVIFVGENSEIEDKLSGQVTRERMEEVEGYSENCGVN